MRLTLLFILLCAGIIGQGQEIKPAAYLFSGEIADSDLLPVQKAWEYSFIGEYQLALRAYELEPDTREKAGEMQGNLKDEEYSFFSSFSPYNAKAYILDRSRRERILMINEAHNNSRHRVFVQDLLGGLYQNGYRYLGLEGLSPNFSDSLTLGSDTLLNKRGYPLNSQYTGYYTREPQFANLIRVAIEMGFTVVAYERTPFQDMERDSAQALHVMRILQEDPGAKILLYCGYAHLVESIRERREENYGKTKWLGAIIQELSGINPLTINQEVLTERLKTPNSPYFSLIDAGTSAVLLNDKNVPFNGPKGFDKYDLLVYHPPTQYVAGRPDWLYRDSTYQSFQVPEELLEKLSCPCLVKAYRKKEQPNSVPVDIIELTGKVTDQKALVLPPGSYRLEIIDNKEKKEYLITIVKLNSTKPLNQSTSPLRHNYYLHRRYSRSSVG